VAAMVLRNTQNDRNPFLDAPANSARLNHLRRTGKVPSVSLPPVAVYETIPVTMISCYDDS
jgi:hypothetical protein